MISLISYGAILLGVLGIWCWGRIFIKRDPFSSLLAGLLIASGVISVTARFIPLYTKELVGLMVIIGIIKLGVDYRKRQVCLDYDLDFYKLLLPTIVFVGVYFRFFHYSNYIYESHDVVYFSPAFEMLSADYWGNLRVPTYYPFEMASNHLFPAATLAAVGFLAPHPSLPLFVEIRYLLIVLFISRFIVRWFRSIQFSQRPWLYFLTSFALLTIYGMELGYELIISSYIYVFLLFEILLQVFEKRETEKELLFFSLLLIIAKAPIFYIAGGMAVYYWFVYKEIRYKPIILYTVLLVVANMISWIIIPPPSAAGAGQFGVLNPVRLKSWVSFIGLHGWAADDNYRKILHYLLSPIDLSGFEGNYPSLMVLFKMRLPLLLVIAGQFIYIITKYYAVFFVTYRSVSKTTDVSLKRLRGLWVYMFISLVGWMIVRNGGIIDHQAHAYLLAALVCMAFLMRIASKHLASVWILIPVMLFFVYGHNPSKLLCSSEEERTNCSTSVLSYDTVKTQATRDGFYHPPAGEPYWKAELSAMILGKRLHFTEAPDLSTLSINDGKMQYWILPP